MIIHNQLTNIYMTLCVSVMYIYITRLYITKLISTVESVGDRLIECEHTKYDTHARWLWTSYRLLYRQYSYASTSVYIHTSSIMNRLPFDLQPFLYTTIVLHLNIDNITECTRSTFIPHTNSIFGILTLMNKLTSKEKWECHLLLLKRSGDATSTF